MNRYLLVKTIVLLFVVQGLVSGYVDDEEEDSIFDSVWGNYIVVAIVIGSVAALIFLWHVGKMLLVCLFPQCEDAVIHKRRILINHPDPGNVPVQIFHVEDE